MVVSLLPDNAGVQIRDRDLIFGLGLDGHRLVTAVPLPSMTRFWSLYQADEFEIN